MNNTVFVIPVDFRCYLEDMGASEAVISCMLKMDKNPTIQTTGCMTLTNLSAECKCNVQEYLY